MDIQTYIHTSIHPSIHTYIHTYIQTRQQHTELDPKDQSESARVVTLSQLAHQVAPGGTGIPVGVEGLAEKDCLGRGHN